MTPTETPQAEIDAFMESIGFRWSQGDYYIHDKAGAMSRDEAAFWFSICREREVALARKVIGVSNYSIKRRGVTMKKRLDLLNQEMLKIIPDDLGITEELS